MKKTYGVLFFTVVFISGMLFVGAAQPTRAVGTLPSSRSLVGTILYVGGNGPDNYSRIQDAIDNASENDTVYVYDDSSPYTQTFNVTKPLHIVGENKETTVIDVNNTSNRYIIDVQAAFVSITNFTIQNNPDGIHPNQNGTFSDNNFYNIKLPFYLVESSNNTISNNLFLNQNVNGVSPGIYLYHGNDNLITNNMIHDDGQHKDDTGIQLAYAFRNHILNNTLINCSITAWEIDYKHNIIQGNSINGRPLICLNNASYRSISDAAQVVLTRCDHISITSTNFTRQHIAIQIYNSYNCEVSYCTFYDNIEGILTDSSDNITIQHNTFHNSLPGNRLREYTIGLCLSGTVNSTVSGNTIIDNSIGFNLQYSRHNQVTHNLFRGNQGIIKLLFTNSAGGISVREGYDNLIASNNFIRNLPDATFKDGSNVWLHNFWGRPWITPRPILGIKSSGGWFLPHLAVEFDLRPALLP